MVPKRPQGGTFGAFAGMDARDQLGYSVNGVADGHAIIGQDNQLRPAVAHLVGDVERTAGKADGVESSAPEDVGGYGR